MNEDYIKEYEKLGIVTAPLPLNYDPDTYGKMLLIDYDSNENTIVYSTETELMVNINDIV